MKLGDHPELFAAILEVLGELSWAFAVHVSADDTARGYRVTVSTGDRFLTHTRQIVISLTVASSRDIIHTIRCQVADMKRDLDRVSTS